jgi:hypothetical protein
MDRFRPPANLESAVFWNRTSEIMMATTDQDIDLIGFYVKSRTNAAGWSGQNPFLVMISNHWRPSCTFIVDRLLRASLFLRRPRYMRMNGE